MIYSALEKKKRTDFIVIENNPEITKHSGTSSAANHKKAPTYAADAPWPVNSSYLPTSNFEKWTRPTYSVYCATILVCSPSSVFTIFDFFLYRCTLT
jgi:hypothetical protein